MLVYSVAETVDIAYLLLPLCVQCSWVWLLTYQ